jgi:hypothetical protein
MPPGIRRHVYDVRQVAQHGMRPLPIDPVRPAQQQRPCALAAPRLLDGGIEVHQR